MLKMHRIKNVANQATYRQPEVRQNQQKLVFTSASPGIHCRAEASLKEAGSSGCCRKQSSLLTDNQKQARPSRSFCLLQQTQSCTDKKLGEGSRRELLHVAGSNPHPLQTSRSQLVRAEVSIPFRQSNHMPSNRNKAEEAEGSVCYIQ